MNHSTENRITDLNLMRSAKPPTISAVVMPAKVDWNATNSSSGNPPSRVSAVMPRRKAFSVKEPKNALASVNTAL